MTRTCDVAVIGAGIVGLTAAYELQKRKPGLRVILIEKEADLGAHASGRNSGVLHSGIYYPAGTLKAKLCVEGARRMRAFAEEWKVPLHVSGKVIVAADAKDLPGLDQLMKNARDNGVRADLLSADEIKKIEPLAFTHERGIFCHDTAVVDPLGVLRALERLLRDVGAAFLFGEAVEDVDESARTLVTDRGTRVAFGTLINAAGAHADRWAHHLGAARELSVVPFKGLYRELRPERAAGMRGNIYPVPDPAFPFLGVHFTRSVHGQVYAGPTAMPALGRENYHGWEGLEVTEAFHILARLGGLYWKNEAHFRSLVHRELQKTLPGAFFKDARRLMPTLRPGDLMASSKVGIRPQLVDLRRKTLVMDFHIEQTKAVIHVLNAISPAFTSAFAFSEMLIDKVFSMA